MKLFEKVLNNIKSKTKKKYLQNDSDLTTKPSSTTTTSSDTCGSSSSTVQSDTNKKNKRISYIKRYWSTRKSKEKRNSTDTTMTCPFSKKHQNQEMLLSQCIETALYSPNTHQRWLLPEDKRNVNLFSNRINTTSTNAINNYHRRTICSYGDPRPLQGLRQRKLSLPSNVNYGYLEPIPEIVDSQTMLKFLQN